LRNKNRAYTLKYLTFKKNDLLCKKGALMRIYLRYVKAGGSTVGKDETIGKRSITDNGFK